MAKYLLITVVVLQWSAAAVYTWRRQYAQALMFFGAGLANGAALGLPKA